MAELNLFHYIYKNSVIHRMDGRIKLICLFLLIVTVGIASSAIELVALTMLLIVVYKSAGLFIRDLIREIKFFLVFIGIIIIVHALNTPGRAISGFPIQGVTWEGLNSGGLFGWRLILMILISGIMTRTTQLSVFKNAMEWFLRPVPFIPETRVGTMFSLTFAFIPLIFNQVSEILEAQKSRGIDGRKNPIIRFLSFARPLLFQILIRADEMTLAMESRCYSEVRTKTPFKATTNDWLILLLVVGFFLGVVFNRA